MRKNSMAQFMFVIDLSIRQNYIWEQQRKDIMLSTFGSFMKIST